MNTYMHFSNYVKTMCPSTSILLIFLPSHLNRGNVEMNLKEKSRERLRDIEKTRECRVVLFLRENKEIKLDGYGGGLR